MQFDNILLVCVGNICRSPMAEYLFKQNFPHINVCSAGVAAVVGAPADEKAISCMHRLDIDMHAHRARQLTAEMLKQADLVLVMSQNQQKHIESEWPFSKGKIFRLGHWQSLNIADPYRHDQQFFDYICQEIQSCVNDWKQHL